MRYSITKQKLNLIRKVMLIVSSLIAFSFGLDVFVFAHNTNCSQIEIISDEIISTESTIIDSEQKLKKADELINSSDELINSAQSIVAIQELLKYKYEQIPLDDSIKNKVLEECQKYDIDPDIMFGLYYVESNFTVVCDNSSSSARGLGQIIQGTASQMYTKLYGSGYNHTMAYDPYLNIELTTYLVRYLQDYYGVDITTALYYYSGCQSYYPNKVLQYTYILKSREASFDYQIE